MRAQQDRRRRLHQVAARRPASRVHIDRTRVYATGISNGGIDGVSLGIEAWIVSAAIAPVEGAPMVETSARARPMPLMLFNSVDDRYVPYGGVFGRLGALLPQRLFACHEEIALWRKFDGCRSSAGRAGAQGCARSPDADNSATRYEWGPCGDGSRIVPLEARWSGHVCPARCTAGRGWGAERRSSAPTIRCGSFFRQFFPAVG